MAKDKIKTTNLNTEKTAELLGAIKSDDVGSFDTSIEGRKNLRYGRFPILTLLYLYGSKKIAKKYETDLIKLTNYIEVDEPMALSGDFSKVAQKQLRFFLDRVVSPWEMLLLMEEEGRIKDLYAIAKPSEEIKNSLKELYDKKHGLKMEFRGGEITMERRPMTKREKKKLLLSVISAVLCVAIIVSTPFIVNVFVPFIGVEHVTVLGTNDGKVETFDIKNGGEINFSSDDIYNLTEDIAVSIPKGTNATCTIEGNGHKVDLLGGSFATFSGEIKNTVLVANGEKTIDRDFSYFAEKNAGKITNVKLSVMGKIITKKDAREDDYGRKISGLVGSNEATGEIANCTAEYIDFVVEGDGPSNATFAGIVSENYGTVKYCTVEGSVSTTTVDIGGVCGENRGSIVWCTNRAKLSQTNSIKEWSPIVSGISVSNVGAGRIARSVNEGEITVVDDCPEDGTTESSYYFAMGAGIVYDNTEEVYIPNVEYCHNLAKINVNVNLKAAKAAGICGQNAGGVNRCLNDGDIFCDGKKAIRVGGINAETYFLSGQVEYGHVDSCVNRSDIAVDGVDGQEIIVGGITATTTGPVHDCYSAGNIEVTDGNQFIGGIIGFCAYDIDMFMYVYCGSVTRSVSSVNIVSTASGSLVAGGIVGFMRELVASNAIFGGSVSSTFFVGNVTSAETTDVYVGGILGVAGKNIYNNTDTDETLNFENNYHYDNIAIGVGNLQDESGNYVDVTTVVEGVSEGLPEGAEITDTAYTSVLSTADSVVKEFFKD